MKPGRIAMEVIWHVLVHEGIRGDSVIKDFRKMAERAIAEGANFTLPEAGHFARDMEREEGETGMLLSDAEAFRIGSEILKYRLVDRHDPQLSFLVWAWKIPGMDPEELRLFAERVWPEDSKKAERYS